VQIAFDQNPAVGQNLKRQAFDYVNQLRTEPSAWQPCLTIFTKIPRYHDVVRLFALEIVNKAVEGGTLDEAGTDRVKEQLMTYLRRSYKTAEGLNQREENAIENKIAQTVTFLFSTCYARGWESIFDDLLGLTSDSEPSTYDRSEGTGFYLRVLNSIHDEIGDQSLARTAAEQDRATLLKDLIRQRDVQKIAQSWQAILSQWGDRNDMIAELTLKAIGKWVSWIDISLVVNQQMLELLFQQLARAQKLNLRPHEEKARDAAIDAFTEITGKKMKTSDKLEMIDFLNLEKVITQLTACPPLSERRGSSQYDTDLAETVAKLVNVTVIDIVRALDSESGNLQVWQRAEVMLQAFLPHVLRFFSDEYDEVCSTVIPSLNDVLSFLRKSAKDGPSSPQRAVMLLPILRAVFAKMRYDETASWEGDSEQEDEAEFQDLRKRLDVLQQTISGADARLYSDALSGLVEQTFDDLRTQGEQLNWRDLELALHEMFLFGDLAIKTGGLYQKNKPNSPAAETLVQMMLKMMEAGKRGARPCCVAPD
jgi:exportin-T